MKKVLPLTVSLLIIFLVVLALFVSLTVSAPKTLENLTSNKKQSLKHSQTKLHLACGKQIKDGWLNVDLNPPKANNTLAHDLTKRFPLPSSHFEIIYAEHFLEHLDQVDGIAFLSECHRVLRPDGVLRLSMPDLDQIVALVHDPEGNGKQVSKIVQSLYIRDKKGRKMSNGPATPVEHFNRIILGEAITGLKYSTMKTSNSEGHRFYYNEAQLRLALAEAGFSDVQRQLYRKSTSGKAGNLETRPYRVDLIIEALP